ncbi:uncharacterized protein YecE (DUF72 family) [Actinomycetospora succinea]|uniref:Uncharacterized protein YecE (DUF72 family) n=1 Tax=Actinomycetospora succinea TaxID=663603 RepID=A0A4R6VE85_9PSEU|nr:DUF72 domain-containing protein [Actinomycetospora succinea]TDQ61062.1 uncharacterized protein YecE (DUF72 family) [Actinomycetospora succinea]
MAVRIGTSGWIYPPWRRVFYPEGLVQRRELTYLAERLDTVEINGSFYLLQRASSYRTWAERTPDDFVFAVKGGRFVTHMKKLRGVEEGLANFFASGPLALGPKLGPVLWQLPPQLGYDAERIEDFLALLPRTTGEAAAMAAGHTDKVPEPCTETEHDRPMRHALEVRHATYRDPGFVAQLRRHGVALVVSDTAGTFPRLDDVTADLVYVRLHGDTELYASGYTAGSLDRWAALIRAWAAGDAPTSEDTVAPDDPPPAAPDGRDVVVYFDNDIKVHAPFDAMGLRERVRSGAPAPRRS